MIRFIISDADGTLLKNGRLSEPETFRTLLGALSDRGIPLAVASGRSYPALCRIFGSFSAGLLFFSLDGTYCRAGKTVLCDFPVDRGCLRRALTLAENSDAVCGVEFCCGETSCLRSDDPGLHRSERNRLGAEYRPTRDIPESPVYKIILFRKPGRRESFPVLPGLHTVYESSAAAEYIRSGADKLTAAETVCKSLHIPLHDVLACGDGENDLTLLRRVGYPVTVYGAPVNVFSVSDRHTENAAQYILNTVKNNEKGANEPVMSSYTVYDTERTPRIGRLIEALYDHMPEIEADRAELLTESYRETEGLPIITRRSRAFRHICENLPITIRDDELIVGSATKVPRGCQTFPEFSFAWLEDEFNTVSTRTADPFVISEETKKRLREVNRYWSGKTTSELATAYMAPETLTAMKHNIFTPGNYFYNGVGHVTVNYAKVLKIGYRGIIAEAKDALAAFDVSDPEYSTRRHFLSAVIESCEAAITYAKRYAKLALETASSPDIGAKRRKELLMIAHNCARVPENGAETFWEACQSFWFVQMLLQIESSGHSISPGRFDQYMYPYYRADMDAQKITPADAQELIDCIWVKLNDLNKCRDAGSAEGFAGYSLFQNLIAGGQTPDGRDATNDLSFLCIQAAKHVLLPQPSFSVRVWNGTPHEFLLKAAELTRTGVGLPAYYNDEVIIPALLNRGLTMEDARDYNIIGCVEPQKSGKTEGWHDAAFFNMARPLELTMNGGRDLSGVVPDGEQIGPDTGDVTKMQTFEEFYDAYKTQMNYMIRLLVNADNAIDLAHMERCPLPFESSMVEDCIGRGKPLQCGGAVYNFTGPQGFGIANMADALYAVKTLVFDEKKLTMAQLKEAIEHNFGEDIPVQTAKKLTSDEIRRLSDSGKTVGEDEVRQIFTSVLTQGNRTEEQRAEYRAVRAMIDGVPKFGNDIPEVDAFARDVAYTYTRPLETYKNPRGGQFQAGLYPVSANVPLGAQTGATADGRLAFTPVADGVSPSAGKDTNGPTASCNSVSRLDHGIASNGTLFNMKFHPSALEGMTGLESFVALIRGYFDQKGSHVQFNVVSRETLRDAQKHPEKYKSLVVRVAGYSALFVTLSKSLQDDIINRTEQTGF